MNPPVTKKENQAIKESLSEELGVQPWQIIGYTLAETYTSKQQKRRERRWRISERNHKRRNKKTP